GLVCMEPFQQPVDDGKAGSSFEDVVKPGLQGRLVLRIGIATIGFEILVEVPDQPSHMLLDGTGPLAEGVEAMDQSLGMHPAQAMSANIELPSVITDDDRIGKQAMFLDTAP